MANQLHIYTNNPTAGLTDGTEVSAGTGLSPISVVLDVSQNEAKAVKCAVRCDSGYIIDGNVSVSFVGTNAAKWKAALDENFADADTALSSASWQDSIEIAGVAATNVIFWIKAMSSEDENPQNDTSVSIQAQGLVAVPE